MARTEIQQLASRRGGEIAGAILKEVNEVLKWKELVQSKDENIKLKAMIYLSNRAYGMPAQEVKVETTEGHKFGFDEPAATTESVQ